MAWRRSSPGFWVPATVSRALVEQRILEESMRLPPGGFVSGWAALRLWGGGFFDGTLNGRAELPVDLVVPATWDIRRAKGIVRHRETAREAVPVERYGIPCADPARACFDAIRWESQPLRRQQIADLALSAGLLSGAELRAEAERRRGARGRRLVDHCEARASDRVLSPQETTIRLLWLDAGLPSVRCNWPVADASRRRIGRPDLLCQAEAVAVEYDGRDHTRNDVRLVDLRKDDAYRGCGLELVRVIGAELSQPARIQARMLAAVDRARASKVPRTFLVARNPPPLISDRDAMTDG